MKPGAHRERAPPPPTMTQRLHHLARRVEALGRDQRDAEQFMLAREDVAQALRRLAKEAGE